MVKPSDLIRHMALDKVSDAAGRFLAGAVGVTSPSDGGFFASLSAAIPAVFSMKDEIGYNRILVQLEALGEPGQSLAGQSPRRVIETFYKWHMRDSCVGERVAKWWYGNQFRKFVVCLNDDKNPEDMTARDFLAWCVKRILSEGGSFEPEGLEKLQMGFYTLVEELDHVPHVPDSVAAAIPEFQGMLHRAHVRYRAGRMATMQLARNVEAGNRAAEAAPRSIVHSIIDNLLK